MFVARGPEELELREPALVDAFLEGALELDVDVLCDGESAWVAGILEHVEPVHDGEFSMLEANSHASRTVPFVAKATGLPLVDHACRLLLGAELDELGLLERAVPTRAWAKEAVSPRSASRMPPTAVRRCARRAK